MSRRTCLPVFLLLAPLAPAQLREHLGGQALDYYGYSVDRAGDVDGDGRPDYVIGAPRTSFFLCGGATSSVEVRSGASGSLLHRFELDVGEHHGALVCGMGDANADGYDDILVANSPDFDCAGDVAAYVWSGLDGSLLHRIPVAEWWELYDFDSDKSIAGAGDVDGDGHGDFLVGDADAWIGNGMVDVYSGATGLELFEVRGNTSSDRLGRSAAGVGDWDGDGLDDVAMGGDLVTTVWSPASLAILFATPIVGELGDPGDFDGDGARDLLVGGRLVSGASGAVLLDLSGWNHVRVAGDIDLDGVLDFVASTPGSDQRGQVVLLSGVTGATLVEVWNGPEVDGGIDLEATVVGDVNLDGSVDVIVGAPFHGALDAGAAFLVSGWCDPAPTAYCVGAPNSAGAGARMEAAGSWSLSTNQLVLVARDAPANHFGLFFYGAQASQVPFGAGFLCVAPPLFRLWPALDSGRDGVFERALDLEAPPLGSGAGAVTAGSTWRFQLWYRDIPGGAPYFNLSDGLAVTFCP